MQRIGEVKRRDLWKGRRTICAELREIRLIVAQILAFHREHESQEAAEIPAACESLICRVGDAIDMAKRMDRKLREYNAAAAEELWKKETSSRESAG